MSWDQLRQRVLVYWLAYLLVVILIPIYLILPHSSHRVDMTGFYAIEGYVSKLYLPTLACFVGFFFGAKKSGDPTESDSPSSGQIWLLVGCCFAYSILTLIAIVLPMVAVLPIDKNGLPTVDRPTEMTQSINVLMPIMAPFLAPIAWITAAGGSKKNG